MEYKKNDIVTVHIDDIGNDGEGIGKIDGYTLFVKDAVIGDLAEARITKVKKNYGYARLEKVIAPSSFRVEPRCAFHRQCGGCQLQAMSYEKQLAFKQDKIRNNLIRIGGFDKDFIDKVMEPIVGMEYPWHYRNKAQYPVGYDKNGKLVTGFYAGRTHDIIPNTDCELGAVENKYILEAVLSYMEENHVSAYRENTGEGLVRHILIRTGFFTGEIMVCIVINGKRLPKQHKLIDKLLGAIPDVSSGSAMPSAARRSETSAANSDKLPDARYAMHTDTYTARTNTVLSGRHITGISVSINTERTNVIMGKEVETIWGSSYITDSIGAMDIVKSEDGRKKFIPTDERVSFQISPLSFYQVNSLQTEKLYSLVLEYAGLTGKETVWDLYCGIGTISLFLAKAAKLVYGVEIVPQAIEDAKKNAEINEIKNVEFFVGEAEKVLPAKYEEEGIYADVIVVDPPRKGCGMECLNTMLAMQPERIVYVSCDSATLARDLRVLVDGGYEVKRVNGVDQFGQGVHVECVVMMQYCGKEKKK